MVQLNNDNRGISLVEVIVSLLVIAVIFTPLLMSFVQAHRVNNAANVSTYSNAAGENVMEEVKAKGIENFSIYDYMQKGRPTGYPYALFNGEPGEENDLSKYQFFKSSESDGHYEYKLVDIEQGTKHYDVKVRISPARYHGLTPTPRGALPGGVTATPVPGDMDLALYNDYTFADFTAFSSDTTILIFPKTSDTEYIPRVGEGTPTPAAKIYSGFDEKAVSYFMDKNEDYIEDKYMKARNIAEEKNEAARQWNKAHPDEMPTPMVTMPVRDARQNLDSIKRNIERTINIKVSKNESDDNGKVSGVGYIVDSWIDYKASNASCFYDSDPGKEFMVSYRGYCNQVYIEELKSLFLLYTLEYPPEEKDKDNHFIHTTDVAVDSTEAPIDFDCYIAIQVEEAKKDPTYVYPTLNVKESHMGGHTINYYSQGQLVLNAGAGAAAKQSLIKDMAQSSNRIFEIVVEVYEHETDDSGTPAFSNLLTTLKSTYVNDTEIK